MNHHHHSRSYNSKNEQLLPNDRYIVISTIGSGTFGTVFLAKDKIENKLYAIKKVFLDPKFKNRELDIVRQLEHPNCLKCYSYYKTREGVNNDVYLHLVTDYLPQTISSFIEDQSHSYFYLKLFGFQMFAGLYYLHYHGVCHRDIKPSNLLIDPKDGRLQICDFGSAKFLIPGEPSVSYIATRSYRAPELLLDCQLYTTAVDIWAAGCVLAEMVLKGKPLFYARDDVNQMIYKIAKIIGSPKPSDLNTFVHNKDYPYYKIHSCSLKSVFPSDVPEDFIDLLSKIFVYSPSKRLTAEQCMKHPFFSDLFDKNVRIPESNNPLPEYMKLIQTPEIINYNFPIGPISPNFLLKNIF